jgi:hypothetical protein
MHFDLKPISAESIPEALAKVERYRLLGEPGLAESICLDILRIEPAHQQALISLVLARTDQFGAGVSAAAAREALSKIQGDYERAYYSGLIHERLGHARLRQGRPGSGAAAFYAFREAMKCYERAASFRPPGNDDATLRWNTCARVIMQNSEIRPLPDEEVQPITGE